MQSPFLLYFMNKYVHNIQLSAESKAQFPDFHADAKLVQTFILASIIKSIESFDAPHKHCVTSQYIIYNLEDDIEAQQ